MEHSIQKPHYTTSKTKSPRAHTNSNIEKKKERNAFQIISPILLPHPSSRRYWIFTKEGNIRSDRFRFVRAIGLLSGTGLIARLYFIHIFLYRSTKGSQLVELSPRASITLFRQSPGCGSNNARVFLLPAKGILWFGAPRILRISAPTKDSPAGLFTNRGVGVFPRGWICCVRASAWRHFCVFFNSDYRLNWFAFIE